jgi:hypothetical protein
MPDENSQSTPGPVNDPRYEAYKRDFEQSQERLKEKGISLGKPMELREWLIENDKKTPTELTNTAEDKKTETPESKNDEKPANVKSVSGEGARRVGKSEVELATQFTTPQPTATPGSVSVPVPLAARKKIPAGQFDPKYQNYLRNKEDDNQRALEQGEEPEEPSDYDNWQEEQAGLQNADYQKYLQNHAEEAKKAKAENRKMEPPKSYGDWLDEQAGMEDDGYQKYLNDQEAAAEQAAAQGLELPEGANKPMSYRDWKDAEAAKKDRDYQNYLNNKPEEAPAQSYRDWKRDQAAKKQPTEVAQPTTQSEEKTPEGEKEEAPSETAPPTAEQPTTPPASTEPPQIPPEEQQAAAQPTEPAPTAETPTENLAPPLIDEGEQAGTAGDLNKSKQAGPNAPPTTTDETAPPDQSTPSTTSAGQNAPPVAEDKTGIAAQMAQGQMQNKNQAAEAAATAAMAEGVKAAQKTPYIGPLIKGLAIATKGLKTIFGETVAEIFISIILTTLVISGSINLIIPIITFLLTPLIFIVSAIIGPILWYTDAEIPFLSQLVGNVTGFKPTIRNFLRVITQSLDQSADIVPTPNTSSTK